MNFKEWIKHKKGYTNVQFLKKEASFTGLNSSNETITEYGFKTGSPEKMITRKVIPSFTYATGSDWLITSRWYIKGRVE